MAANTKYVRLKPYNKRKGFLMRRYSVRRKRFIHGRWYEVPQQLAKYLETVTATPEDPDTPFAFDVCDTRDEALALVKREKRAKRRANADHDLTTLTTADLRGDEIREVDLSEPEEDDDDGVTQRPRKRRSRRDDDGDNDEISEAEALKLLEDDDEPQRVHDTRNADPEQAPKRAAAAKKAAAAEKRAKTAAANKKKKTAADKKAGKSAKKTKNTSTKPPPELDAANWDEDEEHEAFT